MEKILNISSEVAMLELGAEVAVACHDTAIIYLYGELGAGKTTFCRGFLRALGHEGSVKSPTYTLVEAYKLCQRTFYHFDLYRLKDPLELEYMGIRDYFVPGVVCLVEWPEKGVDVLPVPDLSCYIDAPDEGRRTVKMTTHSELGETVLRQLKDHD